MEELQKAREFFARDRFATEGCGAVIESVGDGRAVCSMTVEPQHCNAYGNPMGGAIFTLADFAFAVASNFQQTPTVSITSQISFLATAKGARLTATATPLKRGRSTCFYQVDVVDDKEIHVASVTFTGFVLSDPKK